MRKVIGIGETVFDIIFKNDKPMAGVPGGSVYNSIISLGRAGVNCTFIGETGNDHVGRRIVSFLKENGVNADNMTVFPDGKSCVSLAFLNDRNDAEYIFYKNHEELKIDISCNDIRPDDIVLFGSFFAINPLIRRQVLEFLTYARERGAILYYDLNFRASHRKDAIKVRSSVLENFELADIVRGSSEDFDVMLGKSDPDEIYRHEISFYTKNFILTRGADPVELRADGGISKQYSVAPIPTVSTIGAGDNFNAGLVYGMMKLDIRRDDIERGLSESQWDTLVSYAQRFSANCCASSNNYIDSEFAASL